MTMFEKCYFAENNSGLITVRQISLNRAEVSV